jgi:hypothetical protein
MAFITADRVKDTSTTTGTGNITVSGSAPFGYRTFSTVLSVSDTFYYCIQGQGTSEWEVGLGTYVSSNQFARTTVLSSSASNSAVSFSSGTKNVFITLAADKTLQIGPSSSVTVPTVIGGTTASSSLTLQSTSGVGTSDSILFKVGNNGATTAMTVDTSGNVGIGTSSPSTKLNVVSAINGGIAVTDGTVNTIIYSSTSGISSIGTTTNHAVQLYSNNAARVTINTSGNVGIGTASPTNKLETIGGNTKFSLESDQVFQNSFTSYAATAGNRTQISLDRYKGTVASPTTIANGDTLGWFLYRGYDGTTLINGAQIRAIVTGAVSTGVLPSALIFATNQAGSNVTEAMRIDSSGNVGIGATANASAILDAQSTTKGVRFPNMTTTQKNAVSSPAAGLVVFDTTLAKLCVYSGSAWETITSV